MLFYVFLHGCTVGSPKVGATTTFPIIFFSPSHLNDTERSACPTSLFLGLLKFPLTSILWKLVCSELKLVADSEARASIACWNFPWHFSLIFLLWKQVCWELRYERNTEEEMKKLKAQAHLDWRGLWSTGDFFKWAAAVAVIIFSWYGSKENPHEIGCNGWVRKKWE